MRRVVSVSVFRSPVDIHWRSDRTEDRLSAYARYLPVLVRAHHAIWPDWELRIHHDSAMRSHPYYGALERMNGEGLIRLVDCGTAEQLCLSMMWRLRPAFDPDVEIMLSHDLDSLPVLRLRRMLDEFAETGKAAMLVHACESHDGVMGGGLAVRGQLFRELTRCASWGELISMAGWVDWNGYSSDEHFQRMSIWPMVRHSAVMFRNEPKPSTIPCDDVRSGPSVAAPPFILPEVVEHGNDFAPYIGSAGYEIDRAFDFYDSLPLDAIRTIGRIELATLSRRLLYP